MQVEGTLTEKVYVELQGTAKKYSVLQSKKSSSMGCLQRTGHHPGNGGNVGPVSEFLFS